MSKKTATITLYLSEIIYNIQNNTHFTAENNPDRPPELSAHIKANDDENAINELLRHIGNAYAQLKSQLSEYIAEDELNSDNKLLSPQEETLIIRLNNLPANFNAATTPAISASAHQYIINRSLMGWYMTTSPESAAPYGTLATENVSEIRQSINKRTRPQRKPIP